MPYCSKCGNRVNDYDRFCARCGTQRLATSQVQASRNTVNVNALKQVLLTTYNLADSIDAVYPAVRQKGHRLREFHQKDVMCFLLYLAAADGKLTSQEKNFLNILFDQNINEQGYVQLINSMKITSEYIHEVPLTIQICANIDKTLKNQGSTMKLSAPVFIDFYKTAGQAFISCDGHTDVRETLKLNEYLNHLNTIVSNIMISKENVPSNHTLQTPSYEGDDAFKQAVDVVVSIGAASVSVLQRRMGVSYAQAAHLIDELETKHIIGPFEGSKPRRILITKEEWLAMKSNGRSSGAVFRPIAKQSTAFKPQPSQSTNAETTQVHRSSYLPEEDLPYEIMNESPSERKSYPASIYKVGKDIPTGKYKLFSNSKGSSYYSICNDPNGDDIVCNDNFINQAYVYICEGQYLELCDCYAVPIKDASMFKGTTYGDGEYIVGQEISPGEYKVQANPGEDGYYSLETFASDGKRNIDSNRTFNNVAYVAPKQGQILVIKDCTLSL